MVMDRWTCMARILNNCTLLMAKGSSRLGMKGMTMSQIWGTRMLSIWSSRGWGTGVIKSNISRKSPFLAINYRIKTKRLKGCQDLRIQTSYTAKMRQHLTRLAMRRQKVSKMRHFSHLVGWTLLCQPPAKTKPWPLPMSKRKLEQLSLPWSLAMPSLWSLPLVVRFEKVVNFLTLETSREISWGRQMRDSNQITPSSQR